MAKFWKNLKYHEDEFEKHLITREEINFLTMLQEEMNTQDFLGQADPRFWVIRDYDKIYGEKLNNPKGIEVIICDELAFTFDYCKGDNIRKKAKEYFLAEYPDTFSELDFDDIYDADDLTELVKNVVGEITVIEYEIIPKYSGMFLTQKAAEEHLRANYYHYSDNATTYAMTAWRSKEADMLYEILHCVDFSKIECIKGG